MLAFYISFCVFISLISRHDSFSTKRLSYLQRGREHIHRYASVAPDLSLLPDVSNSISSTTGDLLQDLQNLAIIVAGSSYLVWELRPVGSARADLIDIRKSKIENAGLGTFATKTIPKGTLIGEFPGYSIVAEKALEKKKDDKARDSAKRYMWLLSDNTVLDPTNEEGILELEISYLFGLYKVNTAMARINEPPINGDCNVYIRESGSNIKFYAERDIFADEELYIDYGARYYRNDYIDGETPEQILARQQRLIERKRELEKEAMLKLQPITLEDADVTVVDQDTSNPDGFISKLKKQDESRYKKYGILSPEESVDLFRNIGAGMFSGNTEEDQEIMESILGKKKIEDKNDKKMTGGIASSTTATAASSRVSDAEKYQEMIDYLRTPADADIDIDDNLESDLISNNNKNKKNNSFDFESFGSNASLDTDAEGGGDGGRKPSSKNEKEPSAGSKLLSEEEALELQSRLDRLTDEEVEKVFAKLRSNLSSKLGPLMIENLTQQQQQQQQQSMMNQKKKESVKLPKAPPVDPEIRQKYKEELQAIEAELESLYDNPIATWKDIMNNPQKYLTDEEIDSMMKENPSSSSSPKN